MSGQYMINIQYALPLNMVCAILLMACNVNIVSESSRITLMLHHHYMDTAKNGSACTSNLAYLCHLYMPSVCRNH